MPNMNLVGVGVEAAAKWMGDEFDSEFNDGTVDNAVFE